MTEPNPAPRLRRAAVIFVFITIVLDMVALGMVVPVLPKSVFFLFADLGNTPSRPQLHHFKDARMFSAAARGSCAP